MWATTLVKEVYAILRIGHAKYQRRKVIYYYADCFYSHYPVATQANSLDPEAGMVECDEQSHIGIAPRRRAAGRGCRNRWIGRTRRELAIELCRDPARCRAKVPEEALPCDAFVVDTRLCSAKY